MRPLCIAPFNGFFWRGNRNNSEGIWRSCCETRSKRFEWKAPKGSTLEQIRNNPVATEIKETLAKGEWHPNCLSCKEREEKFGFSERLNYNKNTELSEMVWLDYRPSNLCNLKCRMCRSEHSSLLAAEEGKEVYFFDKTTEKDSLVDLVDWSKLKKVKLLGGEPMVMEETLEVIERAKGELHITTNAFVVSKEIEEAMKRSKAKIQLNISIDAIGETYEYIRVNSKWDRVEENVLRLKEHFKVKVSPVAMIWNAFALKDLFDWMDKHNIEGNTHWVGERWNRLGLLTDEHKEQIRHPKIEHFLNEQFGDREFLLEKWRSETNRLDALRGTDIINLDERFKDYL